MVSSSPAIISCFYEIYYFYLQRFIYKPVGYIPQRQNESEYKKRKM
ncbi:putative hydrogenase domain protein [Phocaeicola vulgatus str. 3775 SL(B) 10 (iv)]|uniref:Putative hydrogenase domain protein n=1 Tax=Phocaeicola vulgatus str. 3775 SL(B) 10 (iv) TaxID=1339350 RepID=A0A078QYJ8_PHOVU|nr:putative hydrogenase domain protein [Phocaeicola vulgatus str. 3775 SL(B) 10 (iv)]